MNINIYKHKYYMYIHICDIFNKSFNQRSLIKQIICSINIDIFFQ